MTRHEVCLVISGPSRKGHRHNPERFVHRGTKLKVCAARQRRANTRFEHDNVLMRSNFPPQFSMPGKHEP